MHHAPSPDTHHPEAIRARDALRRVLGRLNSAESVFVIVDVVELASGTLVSGYVSEDGRGQAAYASVVIHCQAAVCPVPPVQRLWLWVDEGGVHLDPCLPSPYPLGAAARARVTPR